VFTAKNPRRLVRALLAFVLTLSAAADVIAIPDGSFDVRTLNAGSWSFNIDPWSETGGPGNGNGFVERINGFAADGNNHLGMNLGHDVWQDLGVTYQANTRYTLTVAVGNRVGNTNAANNSQFHLASSSGTLFASGSFNASTLPGGTFSDAPALVFDTPNQPSAVGQTIRILLRARGNGRSHFDRIRLSAEPLLPSGAAVLANPSVQALTSSGAEVGVEVSDPGVQDPQLTFFWGDNDGGTTASAWDFQQTLPGTHVGAASLVLSSLSPGQEYLFTVRATNSGGVSWLLPAMSFSTLPISPSVEATAATQVTTSSALIGGAITSTGGEVPEVTVFYGPADGGTDSEQWASSMHIGPQTGAFSVPISGLAAGTNYHFRIRAINSAGDSWSGATLSFTTLSVFPPVISNLPATGITGTTATLRGEVVSTGNDNPVVTIFYGSTDGGTQPSAWQQSVSLGAKASGFEAFVSSLLPNSNYFFRARAVNPAGTTWAAESGTLTTTALLPSSVIFHEIHFKPEDESTRGEFIELYNPGDTPADLTGWRISSGVSYDFPAGTVMPPGGYLVIAQDPAQILATYGVNALGPYSGALFSSGERLNLRNESDQVVDRVDYGVGFPWPCRTDGGGSSIELIHPSLDGELPGSWRASGNAVGSGVPQTYLSTQSSGWKFRRGTTEATSPITLWRDSNFNDATWENGQMPLGYGTSGLNTTLSGMRNNYRTIYLRKAFTVPSGAVPNSLKVRLYLDDGCVIWINGQEVHRRNVGSGNLTYLSAASQGVSPTWHEFTLENTDEILFGGTNVIAVHLLNATLGSSDLAFDIELSETDGTASSVPTPGGANSVREGTALIPPQIDQVSHVPLTPRSGESVTISARITDPDGVASASLLYQVVDPGSYIRLTDAAYATNWTSVPMTTSGGGLWSAVLPSNLQVNRRLVRYRIDFADTLGNSQRVPYADDESPNFAYFVYDGIPAWQGAFRPGQTSLTTFSPATLESLPVYTLVAADQDVINSQYNGSFDTVRMYGSFVHEGKVHDHIQFRNRGEGSTYQAGKNKWRFYFNRGSRFQAKDAEGRPYLASWTQFSGNPGASPWAPLNRGASGLDEMVPFRAFQLAGVPSPHVHHYHFRVVRGAQESPAATSIISDSLGNSYGQYLGDFWGLYLAVEPIAGSFLDERGLPEGNIYKIENNNGDKKEQAAGQPVDSSDWIAFRDAHVNADPTEAWWRQNLDLESYFSFHAINRLTGNVDLRGGSNHYFYRRSSDNRWVPIPWDLDMMFIAKHHWGSPFGSAVPDVIHAHKAILQHPQIALEYRNRAREILDLLASDATTFGGQMGQLVAEISGRVHVTGSTGSFAWADACQWNLHPRTNGTDGVASGQGNHRGNFFRSPFSDSREGGSWVRWLRTPTFTGTGTPEDSFAYLLNYATNTWPGGAWVQNNGDQRGYGYQFVLSEIQDADIPAKPLLSYSGAVGFPMNRLQVTASAFADPQGAGSFAARQWRIAQVGSVGAYEIEPLWTTTTSSSTSTVMNLPSAGLIAGETYRARVRQQDNTGRWSHWSDPVEFTAAAPVTQLVHYWNFNSATAPLPVTQSAGGASLAVTGSFLSGNGQGFSGANARFGDIPDDHLRINNPLTPGTKLDFALPTTGFSNVVVKYETRRSGQGAGEQIVEYTLNGSTYLPHSTLAIQDADPTIVELDFRNIPAANDNSSFGLRIRFNQGAGGTAGNHRFDNLTLQGESMSGGPRLIAGTDALWNFAENWHHAEIPNAEGAAAILGVPTAANRSVGLVAPVTLGSLAFETGSAPWRNRLEGIHALTFDALSGVPEIMVTGDSTGYAELEVSGGVVLSEDLRLDVRNTVGDPEHGALRLRETWSGPGGITKSGAGMASLTGIGKNFTGPLRIEEGILKMTGSSSPGLASEVQVFDGGQLRLSSSGSMEFPAIHATGGTLKLAGDGAASGAGSGGALRYDPGVDASSWAALSADVLLEQDAELHVAGASNGLVTSGSWSGNARTLTKSGPGMLMLSGTSGSSAPAIMVVAGSVDLFGNHPATFILSAGTTLGGSGTVGAIQGPGLVDLGDAEISAISLSGAAIQASMGNVSSGMLRLSSMSPVLQAPTVLGLFVESPDTWAVGDRRVGGLMVPSGVDLSSALTGTTVSIYVPDPAGSVSYGGLTYRLADVGDGFGWSVATVAEGVAVEILKTGEPSGYAQWRNLEFDDQAERMNELLAGPEASAAGDGIANIIRYAHGVGPREAVADLLPRMVDGLTGPEFRFRFDPTVAGVAWVVRSSTDLSNWSTVEFDSRVDPAPDSAGAGWSRVEADPGDELRFYRLEIIEN
jgi:autotransporter-associated beta strand protein